MRSVFFCLLLLGCTENLSSLQSSAPDSGRSLDASHPAETSDASRPSPPLDADSSPAAALPDADADASPAAALPDATLPDADTDASPVAATLPDASPDADAARPDASPDAARPDAAVCTPPDILGSECSVEDSCGCDEGLVCRVANRQTGQTLCFPPGARPSFSACDVDQDCAEGSVCELGLCRPLCDTPETFCPEDDSWCGPMLEGGRNVCQGHCNALPLSADKHATEEAWIEIQLDQMARGRISQMWTKDYTPCGEGAYCQPGIDPFRPYPHCVIAYTDKEEGESCAYNPDCQTGLGCYQKKCRIISYVSPGCPENYKFAIEGLNPDEWGAPDNYNTLIMCQPE